MLREYRVDVLDFYRGTLSARRLGVLIRGLSADSALARALNDGRAPWGNTEHLLADVWALWAKKDHPVRAEAVAKAKREAKQAKVIRLRAKFHRDKQRYGLG